MTDKMNVAVPLFLLVAMSFVFQIQLKIFATEIAPLLNGSGPSIALRLELLVKAMFGWRPLFVLVLAGGLFLVWLMTLSRLELSVALPLASIALVVNSVGAGLMLGEALSLMRIAGILIVASGLALVLHS